jgi:hypothetical protein
MERHGRAGLNRCNGNRIDDRARCEQTDCPVFESCARVLLSGKSRDPRRDESEIHLGSNTFNRHPRARPEG